MSIFTSRPALRWGVPAAIAVMVIGGGAAARTLSASAGPSLPPRSAAQLLVDLQTARLDGVSGTVVQRANLGLPPLPTAGGQGSSDLSSLVSGSHTLRVWYAGPDMARVALLGTLGESDVIRNGRDVWIWDSRRNEAHHMVLPADAPNEPLRPDNLGRTPKELADAALAAVDPTTKVTTAGSARVAGRAAYELVLAPRDTNSLVGQVRLAIDAKEHIPLRVQVYPAGSDQAAIEVAFTVISFARPDPAKFRFAPPPGAKVTEEQAPTDAPQRARPDADKPADKPDGSQPHSRVVGTGWTSVFVTRANADADAARPAESGEPGLAVEALPRVSGAWGSGRLLTGRLFSVLFVDDGRVLAGLVRPERLYEAAA